MPGQVSVGQFLVNAVQSRCFSDDLIEARHSVSVRPDECVRRMRREVPTLARPNGKHHRQTRQLQPLGPKIENAARQVIHIDPKCRVTDEKSGVRFPEHGIKVWPHDNDFGSCAISLGENDSRQHHRSSRTRVGSQRLDGARVNARHQQDAPYCSPASNAYIAEMIEAESVKFRAGQKSDIHLARAEVVSQRGRHFQTQIEETALRTLRKSVNEWGRIEVTYCTNTKA